MVILTSDQLHQVMHISYPDIYKAAMSSGEVWASLWDGVERVKRVDPQSSRLHVKESRNHLLIQSEDRIFVAPKKGLLEPRVGWAMTHDGEPFVWANVGYSIGRRETIMAHGMKAEISYSE